MQQQKKILIHISNSQYCPIHLIIFICPMSIDRLMNDSQTMQINCICLLPLPITHLACITSNGYEHVQSKWAYFVF